MTAGLKPSFARAGILRPLSIGLLRWLLIGLLAGCTSMLPAVERPRSTAWVAAPDAPLAMMAQEAGIPAGQSGVAPLAQAAFALDARLALMAAARVSLDLQYYVIADDGIGHQILRGLRDAAQRGVRVRLLIDDLHTAGMDPLLLGLAAHPNVELRLFNPFTAGRQSSLSRAVSLATDFRRLNHRMHNKLFIADGVIAIVGGRNLANEYFLRGTEGNFIDFDLLVTGAVLPELNRGFDLYWNSDLAYPVRAIAGPSDGLTTDETMRAAFEASTRPANTPAPPPAVDLFGQPPFSAALAARHVHLIAAEGRAYADSPDKADPDRQRPEAAAADTVAQRFLRLLATARTDILLFSPYFIPGPETIARLRTAREAGVQVRVVTNSLAVSDEPLVNIGYLHHRDQLLRMGVELYELSSTRLKRDSAMRELLGSSVGRLHAKLGFLDRRTVLVGSMNIDPRSARINTEIGLAFESPQLAEMVMGAFRVDELAAVYRVRLGSDGMGTRWTAVNAGASDDELDTDPDSSVWQRLKSFLMSWLVSEEQL